MPPSRETAFNHSVHYPARRKKIISRSIKALLDYTGAIIALVIFSPVMLWAAYKIKREDGGPVIFKQKRVGRGTRYFTVYKFRTMHEGAEDELNILLRDEKIRKAYEEGAKLKDDPRLTKIGKYLRRSSVDELPQLINILKGEMSLVGPRPMIQADVDLCYGVDAAEIYSVKPGLTGMWQVGGRSDRDTEFRRRINLYYVRNWTLWLDIWILLKTIKVVLKRQGAY